MHLFFFKYAKKRIIEACEVFFYLVCCFVFKVIIWCFRVKNKFIEFSTLLLRYY
jgi:hypothetical protein